ncbi:MAG: hypothetical protein JRD89_08885, partial [Deltaproteobacteria bacterium]|nr:hypothetical protein [Deltaproteobacteria bacterium]
MFHIFISTSAQPPAQFASEIERGDLNRLFSAGSEQLVLISAPGGCGKSVLAAQFARAPIFDQVLWFDMRESGIGSDFVVEFASALGLPLSGRNPEDELMMPGGPPEALIADFRMALQLDACGQICVVLDGLELEGSTDFVRMLWEAIRTCRGSDSRLVVTTRDCMTGHHSLTGIDLWIIDSEDLRFSSTELALLLRVITGREPDQELVRTLLVSSGGHAALLRLLSRHKINAENIPFMGQSEVPLDIQIGLRAMARQYLNSFELRMLYSGALFGTVTLDALETAVGKDIGESIWHLVDVMPIISAETRNHVLEIFFHDLASDAFIDPVSLGIGSAESLEIRDRVFRSLKQSGRGARVLRLALALGFRDVDLAEIIVNLGSTLIYGGHARDISMAMSRIPTRLLVGNPELLLVRALLHRESGDAEAALQDAEVACRVAEQDDDRLVFRESLLLLAGLHRFLGRHRVARSCLEEALRLAVSHSNPDALALIHANLVICSAYQGDYEVASLHNAAAQEIRAVGHLGTFAAGFVQHASCVIDGLFMGNWHEVARKSLLIGRSHDIPLWLRLAALNNGGAALMWTGRSAESVEVVNEVLALCVESGYEFMVGLCYSGLAVAAAVSEDYESAERLLRRGHDGTGTNLGSHLDDAVLQSAWRRANADPNSALAVSENALMQLVDEEALPTLRLALSGEVVAARLALEEVEHAERAANLLRDRLTAAMAPEQLMAVDLTLSEISRQQGAIDDAISRIQIHEDYLLSGCANLMVAFNSRCFPGLIGVIAAAFGPELLPANYLAILGDSTSRKGLEMAWPILRGDEWHRLASRLLPAEEVDTLAEELRDHPE